MDIQHAIDRHQNIALQFSGGKDSLAVLHLMRPYWDRLTVYWLNTGDPFPEVERLAQEVRAMVPKFCEVAGCQPQVIRQFGIPSDIAPANSTPMGLSATGGRQLIQDRYSCCLRSLMLPLHQRMLEDGITLVIRGQKLSDKLKSPIASGHVEDGIEYVFPLEDWTDADVFAYLSHAGVQLPEFYNWLKASPDCLGCSAYWEDGRAEYLRLHHAKAFEQYQTNLAVISRACAESIAAFNQEIGAVTEAAQESFCD